MIFILRRTLKLNRKPRDRMADGGSPLPLNLSHIYISGAFGAEKLLSKSWIMRKIGLAKLN